VQGQDTAFVVRGDPLGIEGVAEEELAAERAARRSPITISTSSGYDGLHSALIVRTLRSTSRSIEPGSTPGRSRCTTKVSPSRYASMGIVAGRAGLPFAVGPEELLGEPVEVTERIGAHQHGHHVPPWVQ